MMDCEKVARDEIVEAYLGGLLSDADRDAFEEHYFECPHCFDELQTVRAIRAEVWRTRAEFDATTRRPFFAWASVAAVAAAVVLAVGLVLWTRPPLLSRLPVPTKAPPPSQAQVPEAPQPSGPAPTVASEPSLEQLARVEPPRYDPLTLRGAPDDATARFQRGMEQYRKADYAGAVADLRAAAELDPDAAHVRFFLGVVHLLLGQDDDAIAGLRATIALGDSAYLEEAHLYLAKAFLRRRDFRRAETQLQKVIQLRGSESAEARRLLAQLQRLENRSR